MSKRCTWNEKIGQTAPAIYARSSLFDYAYLSKKISVNTCNLDLKAPTDIKNCILTFLNAISIYQGGHFYLAYETYFPMDNIL